MDETHREDALHELERDLRKGESQSLDFKEEFPEQARDLAQVIASFATSNLGTIYIGVDDHAKVVGVKGIVDDQDTKGKDECQKRIQGITQGIDPPVRVEVDFIEKDTKIVVRIRVPKGAKAVYFVEGRPYLRDLASSRLARSSEVEDIYRNFTLAGPSPKKIDEIQSYISALLSVSSDIELVLTSYRDNLINPDQIQMMYDIHVYAEMLYGLSQVKPPKELGIEQPLVTLSRCLDGLAAHGFTMGMQRVEEFGTMAKQCLDVMAQVNAVLRNRAKVGPLDVYSGRVRRSLISLQNDWKSRERRFEIGDVELLKEAFRRNAFAIYRLSACPEAIALGIRDELAELGRSLRELSSTEKYFGYWQNREAMRKKIEQKFSQCEPLISNIMSKVS
jgi:hypothetical protein